MKGTKLEFSLFKPQNKKRKERKKNRNSVNQAASVRSQTVLAYRFRNAFQLSPLFSYLHYHTAFASVSTTTTTTTTTNTTSTNNITITITLLLLQDTKRHSILLKTCFYVVRMSEKKGGSQKKPYSKVYKRKRMYKQINCFSLN